MSTKKKTSNVEALKAKLNSPEYKAKMAKKREERAKVEEARRAKMTPIERLADDVTHQLIRVGISSISRERKPNAWLKGHNLSSMPLWGYWKKRAEKDGTADTVAYTDMANSFALDLPKALLEEGNEKALLRLHTELPLGWDDRDKEVNIGEPIEFTSGEFTACGICKERYRVSFDGKEYTILNECKYPKGAIIIADVAFPSGKIVVENDSRELFPNAESKEASRTENFDALSLDYARAGCAHFFVGNCCPGIYQNGKDHLVVGNPGPVKGDPYKARKTMTVGGHRYRRVAGVCTDLWWYSLTDYDKWTELAGQAPGKWQEVISVQPGLYRFTHLRGTYQARVDYDAYDGRPNLHTVIHRIGDVGKVEPEYKIVPA